ncbi:MAG: glycogen synthase [Elusimicrobiaceae bacterium]|nr:glycogen synthase [Elusimicrobiaceae bacterium]
MNIVLAASEAFPFCKTGGLADVVGALCQQFASRKNNKVLLFLPHYRNIVRVSSLKVVPGVYLIPVGDKIEQVSLSYINWGNVLVFFVGNRKYFDRPGLYRTKDGEYPDNDERFILFSRAVLEGCKFIGFRPDLIHCHDWQTGLIPAYLKTVYKLDAFYTRTRSLYTIHNIAYQGHYPYSSFRKAGFHPVDYTPEKFEYYGGVSFLKSGLVFADNINTVSPNYAREVQTDPAMGFGLEGLLRHRADHFCGIVNGIDTEVWDPELDPVLPVGYDAAEAAKGKLAAKLALQQQCKLEQDPDKPLVGIVSRLDYQKGLDIVLNLIERFKDRAQFVVLGMGDPMLEKAYQSLARNNAGKVSYNGRLDEDLAHRIYAGSDLFLMPSRFEPCGLSQLIAMKYGALPVVSRVGGLVDTVKGFDGSNEDSATGFFINNFSEKGICQTLEDALKAFGNKKVWGRMVKNAMRQDLSWDKSAQAYLDLYRKTVI